MVSWTDADILSGETMTLAVSAKGTTLEVFHGDTWKKFWEVKSTPEVGKSADMIDATSLDSEIKENIPDIPSYAGELSFTMNAIPVGAEGSNLDLVSELSENSEYKWRITWPQLGKRCIITANWVWRVGAGAVSSPLDIIIVLIPKTAPAWSNVLDTYIITYDANGGEGTTDDATEYGNGEEATILECAFTYSGKQFIGWNTRADGTGATYDENDTVRVYENMTLYAMWSE